jgi:hypothetical protein
VVLLVVCKLLMPGDKPWEAVILGDFAEFRKAGLAHPLMAEIEKQFAGN